MWQDALSYLLHSRGNYRLHSPFVYDFFGKVLRGKNSEAGERAYHIYREMFSSKKTVYFEDMGAGSKGKASGEKEIPISQMAKRAARRRNEGEFLLRLSRFCQPERMLELGTHLGISAMYQKLGHLKAEIHSIEGSKGLAEIALANFEKAQLDIEVHVGDFLKVLEQGLLSKEEKWPYVFVDGNHSYQATLDYFHKLLPYVEDGGLMIFDDIYWSEGMKKAWKEIHAHPEVSVSIDLFRFGLCFIRRPQAKEHFQLRSLRLLF